MTQSLPLKTDAGGQVTPPSSYLMKHCMPAVWRGKAKRGVEHCITEIMASRGEADCVWRGKVWHDMAWRAVEAWCVVWQGQTWCVALHHRYVA